MTRYEQESQTNKQRQRETKQNDGVNQIKGKGNEQNRLSPDLQQLSTDGDTVLPRKKSLNIDKFRLPFWQRLSLKTKATTVAIALSTLPILALGAISYYFTNQNLTQRATEQQQARAITLANKFERLMLERYQNIQTIAELSILNDPQVRTATSNRSKQAVLDKYIKNHPGYDSIIVTDLDGEITLQSSGKTVDNYSKIDYFQEVIKTNRPVITPPRKSLATGEYAIFVAAPVVDTATGETIGVVRSRTPVKYFNEILQTEAKQIASNIQGFGVEEYFGINNLGKIFVAPAPHTDYIGRDAEEVFPNAGARLRTANAVGSVVDFDQFEREEYIVSYAPLRSLAGVTPLNWSTLVAQPTSALFAGSKGLLFTIVIGTGLTALLAAAIATFLVNQALRRLMQASVAVKKIGRGQLDTRIPVSGEDELAALGSNINLMADQLQTQLQQQQDFAERAHLFADITLRIRQSLNFKDILKTAVREVRNVLKADRVVIYCFDSNWKGTVAAESIASGWTQTLEKQIDDSCFRDGYAKLYRDGRVRAIDNIYRAGLSDCHVKQLEQYEVKANLVAPIIKDNNLLGLLIAHQCAKPRAWQQSEIDLFTQLATQIGFALDQASLLEQVETARSLAEEISQEQRRQKETLQHQLVELLTYIEGVASGDLTVRAEVTSGEIGTVADFFNAIIESLRQIVTQVKKAAAQVNISVDENEGAIRQLAEEAHKQAEDINHTLSSVEQMSLSIQAVAKSANQAAEVAATAYNTAETGEAVMNRTVESILNLQETVSETANKVKFLGESSQQISRVVSLINQIALQTNVLAINASIEATKAGEEGRGFAVVAEEVGQLANKSAAATKEIEQIVETIQLETGEVVKAMELGTTQVIEGAHLVEDTKQSLGQILEVSHQIYQLVQSISNTTISQAQTSQAVTDLMQEIAESSENTSNYSRQISLSLQRTVEVARQLQVSVGTFKVGDETTNYAPR